MDKKISIKLVTILGITIITLLFLALAISKIAYADNFTINPDYKPINEPFPLTDVIEKEGAGGATILVLQIIAGGLLYFAAPVAIIMIAMAAFGIVMGGAESEKIEQSKKNLTWSVIGLLVIILSYSIVRFAIGFAIKAAEVTT
jgi:hypothetical protein